MGEYREWASASALVRTCWAVTIDEPGTWTNGGTEFWGLAYSHYPDGRVSVEVAGPALAPREMAVHPGEVSWGVEFEPHVAWRGLDKAAVLDQLRSVPVERVREQWFYEVGGVRLPVPGVDGLDAHVEHLRRAGLLVTSTDVDAVLAGDDPDVPERTLRRRFQATTGLRRAQVEQLRRARTAVALLQGGATPADAAAEAGYADQAHLTRELRRLTGLTPARLAATDGFSMT